MGEVKVGLMDFEGRTGYLRIDRNLSLTDNIEVICKANGLILPENYALRFWNQPDTITCVYITEENFKTIKDGDILKISDSFDVISSRIFKNLKSVYFNDYGFKELLNYSTDDGFIRHLVDKGKHEDILELIQSKDLQPTQMTACLGVLFVLLKKNYIKEIAYSIVERVINFVRSDEPALTDIQYGLIVLCQILYLKKRNFDVAKEMISCQLTIADIIPYLWTDNVPNLQLNALMFINALTKYSNGDKRKKIVKELNKNQNRDYIFNGIIKNKEVSSNMAHELYVYQTYMLSAYSELLGETADLSEIQQLLQEFTLPYRKLNSIGEDPGKSSSMLSLNSLQSADRSSFGSILDDNLEANSGGGLYINNINKSSICRLTYKALCYYKKYNSKNFFHSEREESGCGQGVILTADKVMGIIVKILDVGHEPSKSSEFYHPLLFNASLRLPFIYELFSKAMVMVSRTRKEMKGYTPQDYEKIFIVLEKELKLILDKKPINYKELTNYMRSITYKVVSEAWEEEKRIEWKKLIECHPSVLEIRRKVEDGAMKNIFEQRIKVIQKGGVFPKIPEKKNKNKFFFIRLSENRRYIHWGDWNDLQQQEGRINNFSISDIKYFITGKACPHIKDNSVKDPEKAFSIIFSDDNIALNCVAENASMCNIWADAFYLLLGKQNRSDCYKKELKMLVDMECTLNLLELQEVPIPFEPPPVPPQPSSIPS